jgi:3-oxoacyl-[acyl-carrier protein] reductase
MHNVVVTGASRGLGLAIAKKLASKGYRVIAVARSSNSDLNAAIDTAQRTAPDCLHFIPQDLGNIDQIPGFVKTLRKRFGTLYGLVNNAGIGFDGVLAMMADSRIEELLRINALSPIILTKHIVRSMLADGGGRIVNIASVVASSGCSGLAVYGATKASLVGFTRSLAREVGQVNVNVNAVAPGFIVTHMTRKTTDEDRQRIERRSALKRLTEAEDVAHAVEFLLSDQSRNITGTVMTVDAGSTA